MLVTKFDCMTCGFKDCDRYVGEEFEEDELIECCSCTSDDLCEHR